MQTGSGERTAREPDISTLFTPIALRGLEVRNRVFLSPMCQYSAADGTPNLWHLVHLGARAAGGAGLVMTEATAVSPEGRITPADTGIWADAQAAAWAPITGFIRAQGAAPAIQLAHAGRKASTARPWDGGHLVAPADGGWQPVGPSALPYSNNLAVPTALSTDDIDRLVASWASAAERAVAAGFEAIELHFAHGYLIHQFLSPLSNARDDPFGGSLGNRARFPLQIARAVRHTVPDGMPLLVRISATEYVDGGWDLEDSVQFSGWLKEAGVDLIDVSSGGNSPHQTVAPSPGYQVPFAHAIRERTGVPTGAVGLITDPHQAEKILADGHADVVLLGRELLRNPYWPLHAADALGDPFSRWPVQYLRSAPQ